MDRRKGRQLWLDGQNLGLTLVTDPTSPTRMGNSVSRDTTPDLTFAKRIPQADWINTQDNLGSDHYLIQTTVRAGPRNPKGRQLRITNWDAFRQARALTSFSGTQPPFEDWVASLLQDASKATKLVPEEANLQEADSKLLHMWEALASLQRRYKHNKLNRTLRKRISTLTLQIEDYAQQLTRQNWHSTCDSMERQPNLPKTWNILRCLLDPANSKNTQQHNLQKLFTPIRARTHKFFKN